MHGHRRFFAGGALFFWGRFRPRRVASGFLDSIWRER
jgi:hypothetical protein